MVSDFIGRGWGFPLRVNSTGGIGMVSGTAEIEESMHLVLGTAYGERPMRPDFGCGVHDYVFAAANATTAGQIAYEVRASLNRWESRIIVEDVVVSIDPQQQGRLYIDVGYTIRGTNEPRNLVFPFYTIPEEGQT